MLIFVDFFATCLQELTSYSGHDPVRQIFEKVFFIILKRVSYLRLTKSEGHEVCVSNFAIIFFKGRSCFLAE